MSVEANVIELTLNIQKRVVLQRAEVEDQAVACVWRHSQSDVALVARGGRGVHRPPVSVEADAGLFTVGTVPTFGALAFVREWRPYEQKKSEIKLTQNGSADTSLRTLPYALPHAMFSYRTSINTWKCVLHLYAAYCTYVINYNN